MILLDHLQERANIYHARTGRPFATLTYAQSLDGSISSGPGERLILSGSETKQLTHQIRAHHDAILVGIGTVLADDPRLTARLAGGRNPQPIILDSQARIPIQSQLFQHPTHRPWIAVTDSADAIRCQELEEAGATILRLPGSDSGMVSLPDLLTLLGAKGITSLMVEGGAQVITSFLRLRLSNLLILTVAPLLIGGLRGVNHLDPSESQQYPSLKEYAVEQMGDDLVIWGELDWGAS